MASVVDTSVKHFHSGMLNAPVLNGVIGSLAGLLDACLINGFDVKAGISLVVASGVATLSFSGTHSATVDSVILISGVTGALTALNGEQKITVVGSGLVKFATAAADGTAAGTISFKMAPAGWTSPFSGTNVRTYKSADPASTGMILRMDDTTTYQAKVIGYEKMTNIDTGSGAFPTAAMSATGGYWAKSWLANATAIPWSIFADGRMFYINIAGNFSTNPTFVGQIVRGFGDMQARRPGGDTYACVLNCHLDPTAIPAAAAMFGSFSSGATTYKCFMPRDYTGLGSAVSYTCYPFIGSSGQMTGTDTRLGAFPGPFGELSLSAKYLASSFTVGPRVNVPGIYHIIHTAVWDTFKTADILPGTGNLSGQKLMMVAVAENVSASSSITVGSLAFDITGPWR